MEEEKAAAPKWEGKATAALLKPTVAEVWALLEDFCGLHKWLPTIDTCYKVDGAEGLVRYCAAAGGARWCRERLTEIEPEGKWLSYEIMDNNMGFKSYKATLKVSPIEGGDESGCQIEWSFVADPIEGLSSEDLAKYIGLGLQGMAQKMESAFEST